jgi:hypothetical protein
VEEEALIASMVLRFVITPSDRPTKGSKTSVFAENLALPFLSDLLVMLLALAYAVGWALYGLVDDVVALPLRPLVLLNHLTAGHIGWLSAVLAQTSLLAHLIVCITCMLVVASLCVLMSPPPELAHVAVLPFFLDALAQLVGFAGWMAGVDADWVYPLSHTTLAPLLVQLPFAIGLWMEPRSFPIGRYAALVVACSMCVAGTASQGLDDASLWFVQPACYAVGGLVAFLAVVPEAVAEWIGRGLEKLLHAVQIVCSSVYILLAHLWPRFAAVVWRVLYSPPLAALHRWILEPVWCRAAPFVLPVALLATAASMVTSSAFAIRGWDDALLALARGVVVATAVSSAGILLLGALGVRVTAATSPRFFKAVASCASLLGLPWAIVRHFWTGRLLRVVRHAVGKILAALADFATEVPLLAIPVVLACGGGLFYMLYFSTYAYLATAWATPLVSLFYAVRGASDTTLVVAFVALVQTVAYYVGATFLLAPAIRASDYAYRSLPPPELDGLALSMRSPRRCARCWFGPVAHTGCLNLATHHGQGAISNACPRCGWFARTLNEWPAWEAAAGEHDAAGNLVYTRRAWEEFVLLVRASAKASIVPLALMRLAHSHLQLPAWVGVALALSYLVPWVVENVCLADALYRQVPVRHGGGGGGGARPLPHVQPRPMVNHDDDDGAVDCGAAQRRPMPLGQGGDTLAGLLLEAPPVHLYPMEGCSVCLDDWTPDMLDACAKESSIAAAQKLQQSDPACLALRCGHILHVACASDIVRADAARHQRCPLCRAPLSLAGAISAGLFN